MSLDERRGLSLKINEIFYSIQGESTYAGLPSLFIRLTACDLRCTYCDTEYAFFEGNKKTLGEILDVAKSYGCPLIEVTGGEPLLQKNVHPLMELLCDEGYEVMIETSGAHDISMIDPRVKVIMDLKCPSSGESARNRFENIPYLQKKDQLKFVMGTREDYDWLKGMIETHCLKDRVGAILVSPVFGKIDLQEMAKWILDDHLPVRFQVQLHKIIWSPTTRGV
ncbi:MAG: radical SAM protein [Verrucomicrobiota bacterium]